MLIIDPTLIGRKYKTSTGNQEYTLRGVYVQDDARPFVIGEYPDPTYKCNRFTTHKLNDCLFTDYVAPTPSPTPTAP